MESGVVIGGRTEGAVVDGKDVVGGGGLVWVKAWGSDVAAREGRGGRAGECWLLG